jgi:hypothetical protein
MHKPGKYYAKEAVKHGCTARNCNSDHVVVKAPPPYHTSMTMPMHRELANGTEAAILKWLAGIGIILPILACAASAWLMGGY